MNYKKYLIIAAIVFTLIFPEYMFTGLGVILLTLVIILFVVDVVIDIYLVVAFFIQHFKEK